MKCRHIFCPFNDYVQSYYALVFPILGTCFLSDEELYWLTHGADLLQHFNTDVHIMVLLFGMQYL